MTDSDIEFEDEPYGHLRKVLDLHEEDYHRIYYLRNSQVLYRTSGIGKKWVQFADESLLRSLQTQIRFARLRTIRLLWAFNAVEWDHYELSCLYESGSEEEPLSQFHKELMDEYPRDVWAKECAALCTKIDHLRTAVHASTSRVERLQVRFHTLRKEAVELMRRSQRED